MTTETRTEPCGGCDCVPGHRCDCWDFRPPISEHADGTFSLPPGQFQRMLADAQIEDFARAIHATKGGGPFGIEGSCECRGDAEAIAHEYQRLTSEAPR